MSSFADLSKEYQLSQSNPGRNRRGEQLRGNVGELMFKHLKQLVKSRRFSNEADSAWNPDFYNNGVQWNESEKEDVAQEFIALILLGDGKIDYLFDKASDMVSLNKLIHSLIKRLLRHRLQKTLSTNVITRLQKKLREEGYKRKSTRSGLWYSQPNSILAPSEIDSQSWGPLIDELRKIPRISFNPRSERASSVWSKDAFNSLVEKVIGDRGGLYLKDFDEILKEILTDSVPTSLTYDDERFDDSDANHSSVDSENPPSESGRPRDAIEDTYGEIEMKKYVSQYADKLDPRDITMLALKGQGLSDTDLMPHLGVKSRQSVQKIRESTGKKIINDFGSRFNDDEIRVAARQLIEVCARKYSEMDVQ